MNDLCTKGAGELAGMIASGEVTSAEVVDAHLARIEEVNPDVNAVTAAAAVDRAVAGGAPLGPLAGVPFTVKENIDVAGSGTTWGVAALAVKAGGKEESVASEPVMTRPLIVTIPRLALWATPDLIECFWKQAEPSL